MRELWRQAGACDLILSQELLRGALNANVIGRLRRTPVVAYMGISPLSTSAAGGSVVRSDRSCRGWGACSSGRW